MIPGPSGQVGANEPHYKGTVKRFHYYDDDHLRTHMVDFIDAYNFGRRLKTLRGLTSYEYIFKIWTQSRKDSR